MDINFGDVQICYPIVTRMFGYYKKSKFTFDDTTLNDLLNELNFWDKEVGTKQQR